MTQTRQHIGVHDELRPGQRTLQFGKGGFGTDDGLQESAVLPTSIGTRPERFLNHACPES